MGYDKRPERARATRPLIIVAAILFSVFGGAKAGHSFFSGAYARPDKADTGHPQADAPRRPDPKRRAAGREMPAGLPREAVPAKGVTVLTTTEADRLAAAVNAGVNATAAASAGSATGANLNASPNAAIKAVGQQAAEIAASAELHKATANLWTTAWEKSWPFIRDMSMKFFGLFRTLLESLARFKNVSGGGVNANADADANASNGVR